MTDLSSPISPLTNRRHSSSDWLVTLGGGDVTLVKTTDGFTGDDFFVLVYCLMFDMQSNNKNYRGHYIYLRNF